MKKQNGFSLIETLMAVAITSILAIITATVVTTTQGQVHNIEAKQAFADLRRDVALALKDRDVCTRNFNGYVITPAQPAVPRIANYDSTGNLTQTVATSAGKIGNLYVEKMWVEHKAELTSSKSAASLVISARLFGPTGPGLQPQRIPLFVKTSAGQVLECTSAERTNVVTSQDICAINNMAYDGATKSCVVPSYEWIKVGSLSGKCPNQRVPSPYLKPPCTCAEPSGFVDPLQFDATFTARGGVDRTLEINPGPVKVGYDSKTGVCSCYVAMDLDPTGWEAMIACLKPEDVSGL